MFVHVYLYKNYATSYYVHVYNYALMDIHKYIIVHLLLFIQVLIFVVIMQVVAPNYVLILQEASLVDVIVVINWTLMGLHVLVSTNVCTIVIINIHLHVTMYIPIQTYMHTYMHTYLLNILHVHMHIKVFIHEYIFTYLEINECSDGTHVCSHTCTNTIASYTCDCNTGFLLETDGITCSGMCTCKEVYSCM